MNALLGIQVSTFISFFTTAIGKINLTCHDNLHLKLRLRPKITAGKIVDSFSFSGQAQVFSGANSQFLL